MIVFFPNFLKSWCVQILCSYCYTFGHLVYISKTMLHNQVALESVRFEIDSIDQVARSPDSRRNVTVSRGSQEAPPLLLSPDVSSPIKKVVSDFAADVCRAASPTVLASTPPRRRARTPQLPPPPSGAARGWPRSRVTVQRSLHSKRKMS